MIADLDAHPGIKKKAVVIRSVNLAVTLDTGKPGTDTAVLSRVQRRHAMTLTAQAVARLVQQTLVGAAVRLMATGATRAFGRERAGRLVFIQVRT